MEPLSLAALPGTSARLLVGDVSGHLRTWDISTGEEVRTIRAHEGAVRTIAVDEAARCAVSGGQDRTVRVWDLSSGAQVARWETNAPVTSVALRGRRVAWADEGGQTVLAEIASSSGGIDPAAGPLILGSSLDADGRPA
jgi:WD40 repeat protein